MTTPPETRTNHGRRHTDALRQLTQPQAQILTDLIGQLRTDWNRGAIFNALKENRPFGSAAEVSAAAMICAATPEARTPQALSQPGPHWDHAPQEPDPTDGTPTGGRKRACPIPSHERMGYLRINCPACRKFHDFPRYLSSEIYDQLDPQVQHSIVKRGQTIVHDTDTTEGPTP